MKYNYLLLALATVALFSCSRNEVEDPDAGGVHVTIHAYQEGAIDTRTTLVDGGTQVYWEPSDEIKVFFRGSGSRFLSQNTANAQVTDFSGSLNVVVGINEGASGSNTLWGLYPYRADATSDGASVTTTLPAEQTGRAGSFAKNTNITLAQSTSFDLAFYNVTGGIRFSLTQEGVKEVIFEGQNNETIAGKVKIAFADGVPAIQEVVEGQTSITLSAPNGGTFETGKWYYIVALPGTLSNGFKMTFNTDTQYATLKSSGSKTIKRGIFGSLADADEGLIYKDKEGGNPQTGNIVFADPAAKYACVAKFDTNGDGEVSIEEAEAATSFSGLFTNWNTVESFDEIRYFKNVHGLSGVFKDCNKLVSIAIPENITNLGTYAFSGCSSLAKVVLPSGITAIGNYTFQNCSSLGSIEIPSSVTSVGQYAFYGCSSLSSIELPSGIAAIANYTFQGCRTLCSVDIPSTVTSIGQSAFAGCESLLLIALPSNLKTIGQAAFMSCKSLSQITIPDGVTSLGSSAFSGCTNLAIANIPSGITSIPASCFDGCKSLTSVSIPSSITSVGDKAFYNVPMWNLELPSSILSLGSNCFKGICCIILPSTVPIAIQPNSFNGVFGIFVPSGLIDMYKAMTYWADYSSRLYPINSYKDKNDFTLGTTGAIDLGLSVNWAANNIGASTPEEYGKYFGWGDTEGQVWNGSSWSGQGFYRGYSYVLDENNNLKPEYDAAHICWGEGWRLPTESELQELIDNCWLESSAINGVLGYMFYGVHTGNKLFLPLAGYGVKNELKYAGTAGYYGSGTFGYSDYGRKLEVSSYRIEVGVLIYYCGRSIRPVCDK